MATKAEYARAARIRYKADGKCACGEMRDSTLYQTCRACRIYARDRQRKIHYTRPWRAGYPGRPPKASTV